MEKFLITYSSSLVSENPIVKAYKVRLDISEDEVTYPERTFAFFFCESEMAEAEINKVLSAMDLLEVINNPKNESMRRVSPVFLLGKIEKKEEMEGIKNKKAGTFIPLTLICEWQYKVV